jgi:hypothetical protein
MDEQEHDAILPDLPNGKWSPEQLAAAEEDVQRSLVAGYREAMAARGISEDKLARMRAAQLRAARVQLVKIKGHLPRQLRLPRGYKVITPTERLVITDPETGGELIVDPGETLIEYKAPDWSTREKAMASIEAIMGYRSEEQAGGDGRTVIVVNTSMPLPKPPPTDEQLALIHGTEPDAGAGGNGNNGGNNGGGGHAA